MFRLFSFAIMLKHESIVRAILLSAQIRNFEINTYAGFGVLKQFEETLVSDMSFIRGVQDVH